MGNGFAQSSLDSPLLGSPSGAFHSNPPSPASAPIPIGSCFLWGHLCKLDPKQGCLCHTARLCPVPHSQALFDNSQTCGSRERGRAQRWTKFGFR